MGGTLDCSPPPPALDCSPPQQPWAKCACSPCKAFGTEAPCGKPRAEAPCLDGLHDAGSHELLLTELGDLLQRYCDQLVTHVDRRLAVHHEELRRRLIQDLSLRGALAHGPTSVFQPPRGMTVAMSDASHHGAGQRPGLKGGCMVRDEVRGASTERSWAAPYFGRKEEMLKPSKRASSNTATRTGCASARARRVVESTAFEASVCFLTVINVIFVGIEVEATSRNGQYLAGFFHAAELVFTVLFTAELTMRLTAYGLVAFCCGHNRSFNILDAALVLAGAFQVIVEFFQRTTLPSFNIARIVRMFRTIRIFRIVRVMKFFRPLRILVYSLMHTLKSFGWTVVLMVILLYLFGVIFTMAAAEVLSGSGPLKGQVDEHFGSLAASMESLFKAMSGGMDWDVYAESLDSVSHAWTLLFMGFVLTSQIAVLNVFTGMVCEGAIESAQQDQDVVVQSRLAMKEKYIGDLQSIFSSIDDNGDRTISLMEFEDHMDDPLLRKYFAAMDLTTDEARSLFKLLDTTGSHVIDMDDFVSGCLRLKGTARSLDLHMMMYQSKWTMKKLTHLIRSLEGAAGCGCSPLQVAHDGAAHADEACGSSHLRAPTRRVL